MDPATAQWLAGPQGQAALARARSLAGDDLQRSSALRAQGLAAEQVAALLTQTELARSPRAPQGWLMTRDGLEQGTDPRVAKRRGALLAATGVRSIVDASAGLGFDSAGLVASGLEVTAIERDPATASLLAHNVPAATVLVGNAEDLLPQLTADAIFIDPARRVPGQRTTDGSRAQSERDPARWSPPLGWVLGLAPAHRVVAKVAPGIGEVPPGWRVEWVSVDRTVVEATMWSFDAIAPRQAVVIDGDGAHVLTDDASSDPPSMSGAPRADAPEPGSLLLEPDPAVVTAGLVDTLARRLGATTLPGTHWLIGDDRTSTPFARAHAVVEELPARVKELRRALRDRGITNPTIKSGGTGIDANRLRRELQATAGPQALIAVLRIDDRLRTFLIEPVVRAD